MQKRSRNSWPTKASRHNLFAFYLAQPRLQRGNAIVADRTYVLEQGDCIYLDSSVPHKWENLGEIEVRAFWINTPTTF